MSKPIAYAENQIKETQEDFVFSRDTFKKIIPLLELRPLTPGEMKSDSIRTYVEEKKSRITDIRDLIGDIIQKNSELYQKRGLISKCIILSKKLYYQNCTLAPILDLKKSSYLIQKFYLLFAKSWKKDDKLSDAARYFRLSTICSKNFILEHLMPKGIEYKDLILKRYQGVLKGYAKSIKYWNLCKSDLSLRDIEERNNFINKLVPWLKKISFDFRKHT